MEDQRSRSPIKRPIRAAGGGGAAWAPVVASFRFEGTGLGGLQEGSNSF